MTGQARSDAAGNLQQTLLIVTPLILCGLAVAFAFRCGLFNIGGQGQYLVGAYFAVWIGSSLHGLAGPAAHPGRDRRGCARGRRLGRDRRAS